MALLAAVVVWCGSPAGCADRTGGDEPSVGGLTARGVALEVPAGTQTLVARGSRLELRDGGVELLLTGETSIEIKGSSRLEARADRMRVTTDGPVVELSGGVRAVMDAVGRDLVDGGS
jgi:hypothetical protein